MLYSALLLQCGVFSLKLLLFSLALPISIFTPKNFKDSLCNSNAVLVFFFILHLFRVNLELAILVAEAYKFIDFLKEAGQTLWQVFPLGPTGYGDSPYQCFSAFAGNPLLVSPEKLKEDGFLSDEDLKNLPQSDPAKIDYGQAIDYKKSILKKAYHNFKNNSNGLEKDFEKFCEDHKEWLNDFALIYGLQRTSRWCCVE